MGTRYLAQNLDGEGPGAFVSLDLPLQNVKIQEVLSGHNSLNASISPEYRDLMGPDGETILKEWGTAIWCDEDGEVSGGILSSVSRESGSLSLEAVGYTGYLVDMPYVGGTFFVETDPLDIFRHIWQHVQGQPHGDLDFQIDPLKSGLKIGTELRQVEFDTESGPVSFEAGPYKLAWYQNHNLAGDVDKLAADTPFDWRERHYWQGEQIAHSLELGYPRLGRRRNDLRFVVGENIFEQPRISGEGEDYASEVLVLGAGEGRRMRRGSARRDVDRLRRVAVVSDSSLRSLNAVQKRAEREMSWRHDISEIEDVVVLESSGNAVDLGDEIRIQGDLDWGVLDMWVRVLSRSREPGQSSVQTLGVAPTNRLG